MGVTSCTVSNNVISGVLESADNTQFDGDLKISWTIQGLNNPSWGTTRKNDPEAEQNYDAWDSANYHIWES